MTTDDLAAIAHRIVAAMARNHPAEAATVTALVLSEILAVGLYADNEPAEIAEFVQAVNTKLAEIALNRGAAASWQLVRAEPARRH